MINTIERKIEGQKENQKEEEEKMMSIEKKSLVDFIEGEIMDGLFNEDGDMLINVSDVTNFSDEEVIQVVEGLGLNCEKAEGDGNFWVSLPEEFIFAYQTYMDMYFAKQDNMTDREMGEVLYDYIQYKGFDVFGELYFDTSAWSVFDTAQIIRVAENLGYECEYLGRNYDVNNDPDVGLFIIRKPKYEEKEEKEMREPEVFKVPVKVIEEILPDTFEYLVEMFKEFVEDDVNSTEAKDYRDWRKNGSVEIILDGKEIEYIPVWPKKQYPGNDIPWTRDKVEDIEEEVLNEIFKYPE